MFNTLAIYPAPKDDAFEAYVERLNELDRRLRALRVQTPNYGHRHQNSAPKDITGFTTMACGTESGPMDLSAGAVKTRITAAERTRRRVQGLCMHCRGVGHFAKAKPLGKRRAKNTVNPIPNPNQPRTQILNPRIHPPQSVPTTVRPCNRC